MSAMTNYIIFVYRVFDAVINTSTAWFLFVGLMICAEKGCGCGGSGNSRRACDVRDSCAIGEIR